MIWDAALTSAVAKELNGHLRGARLRAHFFDWNRRKLTLFFRSHTLRWSLHPGEGWVTLSDAVEPPDESRRLAAEVLGVQALPDERVVRIPLRKIRGRVRRNSVILELITNQWNALVVEEPGEWIRHILWTRRSGTRDLSVGQAYSPPDPSTRLGRDREFTPGEWAELVREPRENPNALLETVAFSSPLNLPALLEREGSSTSESSETGMGGAGAGLAGYPLWLRLKSQESPEPCVLETPRGNQPYPFLIKGFTSTSFPTVLAAMEVVAEGSSTGSAPDHGLLDQVGRAVHQMRGRVKGLEREMAEAADPEVFRMKANLLLARLGEVKKGATEISLTGFHGEVVSLRLDPTLSPHENAEAFYREAARQERAQEKLPPLLESTRRRLEELEHLEEEVREGTISPEEARALLPAGPKRGRRGGPGSEVRLPYKRYRSSGGLEIRVGRGSSDNDALTFQHSRREDVWLHAREASGAHVVLRWTDDASPPARDLADAAGLAALHSKARHAGIVPVDWTRRKHVRKPRRTPPGTVVLEKATTLFVEPDPALPDRLAWQE